MLSQSIADIGKEEMIFFITILVNLMFVFLAFPRRIYRHQLTMGQGTVIARVVLLAGDALRISAECLVMINLVGIKAGLILAALGIINFGTFEIITLALTLSVLLGLFNIRRIRERMVERGLVT